MSLFFPSSFYRKFLGDDTDINRGAVSDVPSQTKKKPKIDPYADFPDQGDDYSDFPDQSQGDVNEAWRSWGPVSDVPLKPPNFLNRRLGAIHEEGLDSPENILLSSLGGGLEVGGRAIARSSIPFLTKALKLGEAGIGAGMMGTGAIQAYNEPEHAGSGIVQAMLGGLALHGSMRGAPKPYTPKPQGPGPRYGPMPQESRFSEFGKFKEPTEQPRMPGMEHVDFNQAREPVQMPLADIVPDEGPQYQQPDIPFGPRSWGMVPEPRYNQEGQYNLFQGDDAARSMEGVPRQSPFQFGPTPQMEDFAPRPAPAPKPKTQSVTPSETVTGQGKVQGVEIRGDTAIFTAATDANQAIMRQRGYAPTGTLENGWPVWKLKEDLGDTAFTRSLRASLSRPKPEGMQTSGSVPLGEGESFVLPERLAGTDKFNELAAQGYEVGAVLPNGDVRMVPSKSGGVMSDPFGFGVVSRALGGLRERMSPAGEPTGGGGPSTARVTEAEVNSTTHVKDFRELDNRLSAEFHQLMDVENDINAATESNRLRRILGDRYDLLMATNSMDTTPRPAPSAQPVQPTQTTAPAQAPPSRRNRVNDLDRIQRAATTDELDAIQSEFAQDRHEAWRRGDSNEVDHFDNLADLIDERHDALSQRQASNAASADPRAVELSRIQSINTEREIMDLIDEYYNIRSDARRLGDMDTVTFYSDLMNEATLRRGELRTRNNQANAPAQSRFIDPDEVTRKVEGLTDVRSAEALADEYSRLHMVADRLPDKTEANELKGYYDRVLRKRNELMREEAANSSNQRPVSEVMDEFMHGRDPYGNPNMTPKQIERYERKKNKPLAKTAEVLGKAEGLQNIATTVDPMDFSESLSRHYATQELRGISDGPPGLELRTNVTPSRLGAYGSYKAIWRSTTGKPLAKIDFTTERGIGRIGSYVYDHTAGIAAGRASIKLQKALEPYNLQMPSGSFSRYTLNFMDRMGRLKNNASAGFINLAELFGKDPDSNKPLVNYIREFFTKKNAQGQNVVDVPKLAEKFKQYATGEGPNKNKKPTFAREAYNAARGLTTTLDVSAPLRQGLPLIFNKNFWTSMKQMKSALGDEGAFQKTLTDLRNRPLFQRQWNPETGKLTKSFAELVGMKLSDLHERLNSREESIASNWAETGGMFGSDVPFLNKETGLQRGYQKTMGRAARATNRGYTAYLNQLRADAFEGLLADAYRDFKAGTKGAKDPYTDLSYAREIADTVNTLTGRGPLKIARPGNVTGLRFGEGGKVGWKETSLERIAPLLSDLIFSPRLMASRVRMLNPGTYMMASPFVRKQYIKGLLSVAGAAGTVGTLASLMGADVSMDTNSADFGKIRMGNTRLDMAGGFQQYLVTASRLITGHDTSSASGRDFELGQGYRPPTRKTITEKFMTNKLHPVVKFAYDLWDASTHQPFNVGDRTAQLFIPLIVGDVMELAKEDPKLLPLLAPIAFGAGSQTYDKGAPGSKFIPEKYEPWSFTGGGAY